MTSILSLAALLTLSGMFLLLDHNVGQALSAIGDRREMIVYLKDEVTDQQLAELMDKVRQYFGEPTYVTREQAWQELSQQIGVPEVLAGGVDDQLAAAGAAIGVLEATIHTLMGAAVALLLVFALQQALTPRLAGLTFLPWVWSLSFVGVALAVAWVASAAALTRILRTIGS